MTEYEAADLTMQLVSFTHELGEAIQTRIEFWSAISYGLIMLAYLAPERLGIVVSSFLLLLYVLFSLNMLQTIGYDGETVKASHLDALRLSHQYGLNLESVAVKAKISTDEAMKSARMFTTLYVPGLFIGTIIFFGATAFKQWTLKNATYS